ncbi:MAG: tetratricopeptide repeat protein [Chloroflexota bacterium]|nr:tetratricopeptide repeat protein [Chloroflexota bacterium]
MSKRKRPLNDGNLALNRVYEVEYGEELETNPLRSGRLKLVPRPEPEQEQEQEQDNEATSNLYDPSVDTTHWLRLHTASPAPNVAPITDKLDDAPLTAHPAGMGEHARAVRMVPTVGARVRTGLRRSTLLVLLAVAVAGALVASGYLLATTPWLGNLTGNVPPAPVSEAPPATDNVPIQPPGQTEAKDDQLLHSDLPAPQPPTTGDRLTRDRALEVYKQGDYAQAVRLFENYVLVSGEDAEAYYHLGMAYMALTGQEHSMADAELAFRTSISLQPDWAAPYQGLAENLMRRGLYEQAIAPAQKATELAPAATEVWLTLGRAYQGAGQDNEAARAFAQASYLAPAPPLP